MDRGILGHLPFLKGNVGVFLALVAAIVLLVALGRVIRGSGGGEGGGVGGVAGGTAVPAWDGRVPAAATGGITRIGDACFVTMTTCSSATTVEVPCGPDATPAAAGDDFAPQTGTDP